MAISKKEANSYARKYYKEHSKYRKKKIEDRKEYYDEHKNQQNAYERKRYWTNPDYRKYKKKYAINYKKAHKTK